MNSILKRAILDPRQSDAGNLDSDQGSDYDHLMLNEVLVFMSDLVPYFLFLCDKLHLVTRQGRKKPDTLPEVGIISQPKRPNRSEEFVSSRLQWTQDWFMQLNATGLQS